MGFIRDEDLIARLRAVPDNTSLLDAHERSSAHTDLGEVLFGLARAFDLRVIPLASEICPALVATPADDDTIVAAATGMLALLVRVGDEPPEGCRLAHRPAAKEGDGWWWVNPFDAALSREDRAVELDTWIASARAHVASRGRPGPGQG